MKHLPLVGTSLISLLCGSCAHAPVHYYTLMPLPVVSGDVASADCCKVQIRRVLVPPEVDRPEIVIRNGQDQAIVLANDTWLAPLRDEIRGALSNQINIKLGGATSTVTTAQEPVVIVEVTRFDSVPARYALVTANWRIQRADPKAAPLRCGITAQIAIGSGMSALVQGYQQAIVKIADQIALDLLDAGRAAAPRCLDGLPQS